MLVLYMAEDVQDGLGGARVSRDVHEVARHDGPERHDAPAYSDCAIGDDKGADGGYCGGKVGDEAVGGRWGDVVVCETVADENSDEDEGGHWVEALDLCDIRLEQEAVV